MTKGHFIDVARDSYFAQAHICLMDAQISTESSSGRTQRHLMPASDVAPQ